MNRDILSDNAVLLVFPSLPRFLKGSAFKGKNLLLYEQISSLKSGLFGRAMSFREAEENSRYTPL